MRQLSLEVTAGCNLSCAHCYSSSSPRTYSRDTLSEQAMHTLLEEAREHFDAVSFLGGEPFSVPRTAGLIRRAHALGYEQIVVHSNLYSMSNDAVQAVSDYRVTVNFSFLGHDEATHDAVTGRPGSFRRAVLNLQRLRAAGVDINANFIDSAVDDDPDAAGERYAHVKHAAADLGIEEIHYDRVRRIGRASATGVEASSQLCGRCGVETLAISSDGTVFPCSMSRFMPIGSLNDSSIAAILEGNELRVATDSIRERVQAFHADFRPMLCIPVGGGPPDPPGACMPVGTKPTGPGLPGKKPKPPGMCAPTFQPKPPPQPGTPPIINPGKPAPTAPPKPGVTKTPG